MITIEVGNIYSRIVGEIAPSTYEQLRHNLSYEDKDAYHKRQINRYVSDRVYLIQEKRQIFRSGLLDRVLGLCDILNLNYDLRDQRVTQDPEHFTTLRVDDDYFRDYQFDAINTAIAKRCGMIRMATGGGKTTVIAGIAAKLERPTVILVHRLDLLEQIHKTLIDLMLYPEIVGRVGGGKYDVGIVTVATVQTVCAALGINYDAGDDDDKQNTSGARAHMGDIQAMLAQAQVVMLDEAHHAPARTISTVLKECENATWRIGFTATDWRDDGADLLLEAAIGPRIHDTSLSDLIERGWLVPAQIFMYPQFYEGRGTDSTHWNTIYNTYYTDNDLFHAQVTRINYEWHEAGRHILTLVTAIRHGVALKRLHDDQGIPTVFLSGKDSTSYRNEILNDVRAGRLRSLIGTSIADEGLDLPILDALNLAGGGKSTTRAYQRIGRTLRPFDGKENAIVIDYRSPHQKLNAHSGKRANVYRKEKSFTFKELK